MMKLRFTAVLVFGLALHLRGGETFPAILSQRSYGGDEADWCRSAAMTSDGGFLFGGDAQSGASGSKTTPNFGFYDYWIVRTDGDLDQQWDAGFGGWQADELRTVLTSPQGDFLLAGSSASPPPSDAYPGNKTAPLRGAVAVQSDYWVVKVDANGAWQWDQSYGGSSSDNLYAALAEPDGGCLLGGGSSSGPDGNKSAANYGDSDFWLVRIDAQGNKLWDRAYGGTQSDYVMVLLGTADGRYLLAGTSLSGADGTKTAPGYGNSDFWIVKVGPEGGQEWDHTFGGQEDDNLRCGVRTPDGGYLFGGDSLSGRQGNKSAPNRGSNDAWLVKVDSDGQKQWDQSYGGSGAELLTSIVATADGGYLLGGISTSPADGTKTAPNRGGGDYWIVRIDGNGNQQWDQTYGGTGNDTLQATVPTLDGNFLLAGYSSSGTDGNKTAPNLGQLGFWVLKIAGSVPPVITVQPQSQIVTAGMEVRLGVEARTFVSSVRYQWWFHGVELTGATNATFVITNMQPGNAGSYRVLVSNDYGAVESAPAILTYTEAASLILSIHPSLTIFGLPGRTYRVEYSENVGGPPNWVPLTNLVLTSNPQVWVDASQPATGSKRFYRVLLEPAP